LSWRRRQQRATGKPQSRRPACRLYAEAIDEFQIAGRQAGGTAKSDHGGGGRQTVGPRHAQLCGFFLETKTPTAPRPPSPPPGTRANELSRWESSPPRLPPPPP